MLITRCKSVGVRMVFVIILVMGAFGVLPVQAASSVVFGWAKNMGGSSYDRGENLAVDVNGNVYSTGSFSATVDFNPGAGTYNLTSAGQADAFVSKLDANGNFLWAKQIGGTSDNFGVSIVPDGDGNVYFAGSFTGTVDFDPNAGTHNLTSAGDYDLSVSKMDANGNFLWAFRLGGISNDQVEGLVTDGIGAIYITGRFSDTVDFDPGAGASNLTSVGAEDIFVTKFDSSGSLIWAKSMPGTETLPGGNSGEELAVDVSGNIYTIGTFTDTVDFDPGGGVYNLSTGWSTDIFISKLDSNGAFVWAKSMGGSDGDMGSDIGIDNQGNVLSTGSFNGTADFDPGSGIYNLTSAGYWDNYIAKLDADGNFVWAKAIGGMATDNSYGLALDLSGNVYTTGGFATTVDFDPGPSTCNLTSVGSVDIFISKLDPNGDFVWVQHMPGTGIQYGMGLVVVESGNIYTVGDNLGTTDFDPGSGIFNLSTSGYNDIFVSKLAAPTMTQFKSGGAQDGWVLESAENSNQGSTTNPTATTFLLGDSAKKQQYRSILSFNTASLPDNAIILKVVLKIKKQGLTGTNPFTTHGRIAIDIREGPFSNANPLQATDFQTAASKLGVGLIANNPMAGGWYAVNLKAIAYQYINGTGITQFRLRFQTDDDNDAVADFLRFYSGNATAANRPVLVIEYYVP